LNKVWLNNIKHRSKFIQYLGNNSIEFCDYFLDMEASIRNLSNILQAIPMY